MWIGVALQSSTLQLLKCDSTATPPSTPCSRLPLIFCPAFILKLLFAPRYTCSESSPRRASHEMSEGVTLVSILNSHMLRSHTKSAIGVMPLLSVSAFASSLPITDLFCSGGYIISRLLTRVIADLPPDALPDFLYRGLYVAADVLNLVKSDAFWEKHLQMMFHPSVFMAASSSLASISRAPGTSMTRP